jgi:methyltransferase (TIGR00027 family)
MDTSLTLPAGVAWTALIPTYARAQETLAADGMFDDADSVAFLESVTGLHLATGSAMPRIGPASTAGRSPLWTMFTGYVAGRTMFYDQQIQLGFRSGIRQVVNLAAGLDARFLRLDPPTGTTFFEVDAAEIHDFKDALLGERAAARTAVTADLRHDWAGALTGSGFRPGQPTMWLAEGLLMYLTADECDALLRTVTSLSAPGSRLATEYFTRSPRPEDVDTPERGDRLAAERIAGLFGSGPAAAPAQWLPAEGWRPYVTDLVAELRRYHRDIPDLFDPDRPDPVNVWLVAGSRH